jgi:hypothetical protein
MVDLLVPPPEETGPGKLTVGKVYGGMLILENWKLSRFGQGFAMLKNIPVSGVSAAAQLPGGWGEGGVYHRVLTLPTFSRRHVGR